MQKYYSTEQITIIQTPIVTSSDYTSYLESRQKYSATRRIFNSLLRVSSGDETLPLMLDILREQLRNP